MAKRKIKLDESEIKALVAAEIRDAEEYQENEIIGDRERAINYYNGEMPDTPARKGWSSFRSRDVADVIGWVLPGIIRIFSASDRIVDYQPRNVGDEAFTDQASDYANYVFWVENEGYRILWDATHDSLLIGDGIVKTWWDDTEEVETSVHSGLSPEQIAILLEDPDIEILSQKQNGEYEEVDPETGMAYLTPLFDVKIKRVISRGRLRLTAIEPENFLIDKESITIEDARFVAHRDPHMTRTKLLEMGFDKQKVDDIPRYAGFSSSMNPEASARNPNIMLSQNGDKSYDRIELYECYIRADVDDDGIAETVRAYYAGANGAGELLEWEVFDDESPFNQIPCEPVPHRFTSRSLAGEVMDIQQINTVLYRQMLDNTYQVNNPQLDIEEGSVLNMDEVVNPSVGGVIVRKKGSPPIGRQVAPSIMDSALGAISAMNQVTEFRTGVSRATMALDPETLQNQTATASNNQKDSAYSQIELIARNQAQLGWKKVFSKILRMSVKHQDRPRTIRLRDEWVEVDPRSWNANMDAEINVGLGTGSRDRDMAMLTNIASSQTMLADRFQAAGMIPQALDMLPKIVKTFTRIAEAAGIRNSDAYYPDVSEDAIQQIRQQIEGQSQQPDPKTQEMLAKVQADAQFRAQELQFKQLEAENELRLKQDRMNGEFALKRYQIDQEIALRREQLGAELALKAQLGSSSNVTSGVNIGGEPG